MDGHGLFAWIVIGIIASFITGKLMRGSGFGFIMDMVVGLIGAVVGGFLATHLGIAGPGAQDRIMKHPHRNRRRGGAHPAPARSSPQAVSSSYNPGFDIGDRFEIGAGHACLNPCRGSVSRFLRSMRRHRLSFIAKCQALAAKIAQRTSSRRAPATRLIQFPPQQLPSPVEGTSHALRHRPRKHLP